MKDLRKAAAAAIAQEGHSGEKKTTPKLFSGLMLWDSLVFVSLQNMCPISLARGSVPCISKAPFPSKVPARDHTLQLAWGLGVFPTP